MEMTTKGKQEEKVKGILTHPLKTIKRGKDKEEGITKMGREKKDEKTLKNTKKEKGDMEEATEGKITRESAKNSNVSSKKTWKGKDMEEARQKRKQKTL